MNNQLDLLRVFNVVAQSSNFKEASVRLGVSPQSVTRAIQALEDQFGEPLFYRNTRNTTITEFGKQMAQNCEVVIAQVDELFSQHKTKNNESINGLVKITMPNILGQRWVLPGLVDFMEHHPNIQFDLRFSNLIDNVVAGQMDIGVRVGFFSNNRNVARRVNQMQFYVVATPELLAKTGMPKQVSALSQLPYTGLIDQNTGRLWPWSFAQSPDFFPASPVFATDDPEAELSAVLAGVGYGQIADFLCEKHIIEGRLVKVLTHETPNPWGIYVYRPQLGPVAPRVRVVFDYLVELLSNADFSQKMV